MDRTPADVRKMTNRVCFRGFTLCGLGRDTLNFPPPGAGISAIQEGERKKEEKKHGRDLLYTKIRKEGELLDQLVDQT